MGGIFINVLSEKQDLKNLDEELFRLLMDNHVDAEIHNDITGFSIRTS